jgi:tRNA (cmo5U34)-methyltransferase
MAKDLFDDVASDYDRYRRMIIPCFGDFYRMIVEAIPYSSTDSLKVLDLGAGTGLVAAFVLAAFPGAVVVGLDVSEEMVEKARERFAGDGRVRFSIMDYAERLPDEMYHVVVSAMSIHHLEDEGKRQLFHRILDALHPDGIFINAELVKGPTADSEALYQEKWRKHLAGSGLNDQTLAEIFNRMAFDKPAILDDQLGWLREAGFKDVDCHYKYFNFSVYSGRK